LCAVAILLCIPDTTWAAGGGRRSMGFLDILLLPRVWISAIFCLAGMGLLIKAHVRSRLRLIVLSAIFFFFGILPTLPLGWFAWSMGLHPSPVCAITKPFLFLSAGRQVPIIFIAILFFISVFSIVGNKLFCGWACPIGAIQEAFNHIPLTRKLRFILPFRLTNTLHDNLHCFHHVSAYHRPEHLRLLQSISFSSLEIRHYVCYGFTYYADGISVHLQTLLSRGLSYRTLYLATGALFAG